MSISSWLAVVQVPVSGMWQLRASDCGGYGLCAYRSREAELRKAAYEEGLELERATVAWEIFERLVRNGSAEAVRGA